MVGGRTEWEREGGREGRKRVWRVRRRGEWGGLQRQGGRDGVGGREGGKKGGREGGRESGKEEVRDGITN